MRCSLLFGLLMFALAACTPASPPPPVAQAVTPATFVGDEVCASCHGELYESYHKTGMGRSLSAFDASTAPERFAGVAPIYNARFDLYYEPLLRGDTLVQREFRLDDSGTVVYERVHAADWVIGSGNATRSYLMNVNGHVTQMPLTWYVERERWDMSPAYEQINFRFSRPIAGECMNCHNGPSPITPETTTHYDEVANGITCERCHGPASDHVAYRLDGFEPPEGEPDPHIVNSAYLDRDQQLAVCQQCHLTGTTVFEPGENMLDFVPGEPLSGNRSVFVTRDQLEDPERFGISSHALRLAKSECFTESAMTCTTCHDPHQPVAELDADHFNTVCQSCHNPEETPEQLACNRPDVATLAEAMTGDCQSCHLQESGTSDIPHVTFTDHWIRRTLPEPRRPEDIARMRTRTTPFELVQVVNDGTAPSQAEADVEAAIAYFKYYDTTHRLPDYLPRVIDGVQRGLAADADRVEGRIVLGRAFLEQGNAQAAVQAFADGVAAFPDAARLHYWHGRALYDAGRLNEALAPLKQALDLQPKFVEAALTLAEALQRLGRANEAIAFYEYVIAEDPIHHPKAWNDLGFIYLNRQALDQARTHLDRAIALDPDLAVALVNRGAIALMQQTADAASYFERAIAADAEYAPAYGNLALIYAQAGRTDEARSLLRTLLTLTPGDQRARGLLQQLGG
ncbi:MAG: tetratricopeptide repeat protein [Bacteroidota bacterium]